MADDKAKDTKETEDKKAAPAAPAQPGPKNPLVTVLLVLNILVMGGMSYMQFNYMKQQASEPTVRDIIKQEMKADGDAGAEEELVKTDTSTDGKLLQLEGFTVNLAKSDGPRRFVRLNTVLKFSNESKETEFTARQPQIRDTIISILNSKRPEDLLKREGKTYLKEEIKAAINSFLIDGEVTDVFYVGFQIN
ncbi:MAG: flagellar basal body-associated FliL family protein [Bacteriovoracaceae bacterium]|nr:flagellar basal body-associated FliL family protein [Bacteriovoracaceae bacterium]